ncbi:DUF2523 domain-containing protein [Chitinimonas sp.]|uniref:DUF2523 domain-containing protein n=1 Tax=Chitinimonas sp. TaxID=1934313 RepID=UPI002F95D976
MPAILAMLGGLLLDLAKPLIGRILLALGIGFIAYKGADAALDAAKGYIRQALNGVPADILAILGLCGVSTAISIVFSAYAAKLGLKGLNSAGEFLTSYYKGKG